MYLWDNNQTDRTRNQMTIYQTEIYEQPAALNRIINSNWDPFHYLMNQIGKKPITRIMIAARGTSDNAAIYAKYLLSAFIGIPVVPQMFWLYWKMRGTRVY
jgi:glucosamine--fructose-6-phosphate aminotransferase (isomerizing)